MTLNIFPPLEGEYLSSLSPRVTTACPLVSSAELSVMKRKRGRPKGSTKKPSADEELAESLVSPGEDSALALGDGGSLAPRSLECPKCGRKFSNRRQLCKHICIIVLDLGEDEGGAGTHAPARAAPVGFRKRRSDQFLLLPLLLGSSTYLHAAHLSGQCQFL